MYYVLIHVILLNSNTEGFVNIGFIQARMLFTVTS